MVLYRSAAAAQALHTRCKSLSVQDRQILILANGRHSIDSLLRMMGEAARPAIVQLQQRGFLHSMDAPAPVVQTAAMPTIGQGNTAVSLFTLLDGDEGVIEIISQSGCLGLHMCKILFFCTLPKWFCGGCLRSLYSMRARLPVKPLRSRSAQGNQGFLDERDERAPTCIRLQTVVY